MEKLLIFDYDGVIADTLDILWETFEKVNKKFNFFPYKNKNEFTTIWDGNFFKSISKFRISNSDLAKFYKEWTDLALQNNEKVKLFVDFESIVKKLSRDNYLIIISSNDEAVIIDFLKRNELFDYFDLILGMESGKGKKEKLKITLKKFKISEDRTYFITDTIGDLKELKDFGIKTVVVTWGYHNKRKLEKENPDFIVEKPKDLLKLFL